MKLSSKGGVSHHIGGVLTSLEKYRAIWGIAVIVSQYRAIWGHYGRNMTRKDRNKSCWVENLGQGGVGGIASTVHVLIGRAKGEAKGSCGETVVQKSVFGESVSSLLP